jgi:hypothetical protein
MDKKLNSLLQSCCKLDHFIASEKHSYSYETAKFVTKFTAKYLCRTVLDPSLQLKKRVLFKLSTVLPYI